MAVARYLVTGKVVGGPRRKILRDFSTGAARVLCNFGVLTAGFDEPGITAVVVARPTASLTLYTQMVGRGLRGTAAKNGTATCVIADVMDFPDQDLARDTWWGRVAAQL